MNAEFFSLDTLLRVEYINAVAHYNETLAQDLFTVIYHLRDEENQ